MAVAGVPENMGFFEWLFQLGIGLEGDWRYYADGRADQPEYSNLFSIATTEINKLAADNPVREQYYEFLKAEGAIQGDTSYYISGQATQDAGAIENLIGVAAGFYSGGGGGQQSTAGTGPTGVLGGGQTIRVQKGDTSRYYQVYEFPPGSGNLVSFQYNDLAQAQAALGTNFDVQTRTEAWYDQTITAEAPAEEIIGQEGDWAGFTRDLMRDAAVAAGVRDPGLAGRIANNPEMQAIMVNAMLGDWTEQQIKAAQRDTNFWKNELYPGIENFYGRTDNPEVAWANYARQVEGSLQALGYERDAQGSYATQIGRMLSSGIDAESFVSLTPTFQRAVQNQDFAVTLNAWANQELGRGIDFNDWFGLMAGESRPELEAVAEKAQLQWVSQNQGLQVTQGQIVDLAARTQLSEAEAEAAFARFNRDILALGTQGLGRSGLTEDDVLRAAAGLGSGGKTNEEIRLQVAKIARENDLFDEETIGFYVGFTPRGTVMRPGLQALTPESA